MRVSHRLSSSVSLPACMQLFVSKQKWGRRQTFFNITTRDRVDYETWTGNVSGKHLKNADEKRDEPLPTAILQIGNGMRKKKVLADFADCVLWRFFANPFIYAKLHVEKVEKGEKEEGENWSETFLNVWEVKPRHRPRLQPSLAPLSFFFFSLSSSLLPPSVARIRYVSATIYEPSKHFARINWKHASSAARKSCEENPRCIHNTLDCKVAYFARHRATKVALSSRGKRIFMKFTERERERERFSSSKTLERNGVFLPRASLIGLRPWERNMYIRKRNRSQPRSNENSRSAGNARRSLSHERNDESQRGERALGILAEGKESARVARTYGTVSHRGTTCAVDSSHRLHRCNEKGPRYLSTILPIYSSVYRAYLRVERRSKV